MKTTILAVAVVVFVWVGQVEGSVLYGIASSANAIYTIDPNTGVATIVSPFHANGLIDGVGYMAGIGASVINNELFGTNYSVQVQGETEFFIGKLDVTSGRFFQVANLEPGIVVTHFWHGLATNNSAELLYTINLGKLTSMTASGEVVVIGNQTISVDGRGMAYDDAHGILYATDFQQGQGIGLYDLYTIDVVSGAATLVGPLGIEAHPGGSIGLAYDEITETLYANFSGEPGPNEGSGFSGLYIVDVATGGATFVGKNENIFAIEAPIDGLAWSATEVADIIPEPSTFTLAAFTLLGLGWRKRR